MNANTRSPSSPHPGLVHPFGKKPRAVVDERILQVVFYNHETGEFHWLVTSGKGMIGKIAGCKNKGGYVLLAFKGSRFYAHRLAWRMYYGSWPVGVIDHINGDRANNKIENLRDVSQHVNSQNQRKPAVDNTTGFLGVMKDKKKFSAQIRVGMNRKCLGSFDTPDEAHAAYVYAKRKFHAGCTI